MNDAAERQQPADPGRSHVKLSKEFYIELAAFSDSVYDRGKANLVLVTIEGAWCELHR